jgi:IS5 family transposase
MFKILILQAWYALSDEALEKQIARDLMFRRFIDLSLSEAVPDHSTIWRFRQLLNTENLLEALLEQINHHLEQNSIQAVCVKFALQFSDEFVGNSS